MPDQLPSGSDQKRQHEALSNDVADILLGPDSPVRGSAEFDELIAEHDRLQSRQSELQALDAKLVEVLPGLEQTEAQLAAVEKQLAAEKKKLAGFAGELGKAAFAGLRAGELPDHRLFADRKELQARIESIHKQKSELVAGENAGMMEKATIQAQRLKLTAQIKVDELKIGSLDRALGTALLTSKEKPSVRCEQTEEVLKAIVSQRKLVTTAKEKVKQSEAAVADRKSAATTTLGRSRLHDAASLKSELKEVRKEQRQNEKGITSVRSTAVVTALETQSLREEAIVGEKLKQLWSLKFDLEANKTQGMKMVDESVSRFKGLSPKFKYGAYGVAGVVVLLAALSFLISPEDASEELASSLNTAVQEAEVMSAQADASLKTMRAEIVAAESERKKVELRLQQKNLEKAEAEELLRAQSEVRQRQEELKRREEQAVRDQQKLKKELEDRRQQKMLAEQKERNEKERKIEAEKKRKEEIALRRAELAREFGSINLDPRIEVSKSVTSIAEVKSKEIRGPDYLKYQSLYRNKDWLGLFNLFTGESWTDANLPSASDIRYQARRLRELRLSVFFETDLQLTQQRELWLISEGVFSFSYYGCEPVSYNRSFKPHPDGHGWVHDWQPKNGRAILCYGSGRDLHLKADSAKDQMRSKISGLEQKIKLGEATQEDAVKEAIQLFSKLQDDIFNWAMINQP